MDSTLVIVLVSYALAIVAWMSHELYLARAYAKSARMDLTAPIAIQSMKTKDSSIRASVVICVRNGSDEILVLLEALALQDILGRWEVVVVDDDSTDDTWFKLQSFLNEASMPFVLSTHHLEDTRSGKKEALQFGVKKAKGKTLVFTDVDCLPSSASWLTRLTGPIELDQDIVLGVSLPRLALGKGALGALQAWDAVRIARNYVGWAERGRAYMGVGRNMAVRAEIYPRVQVHLDLVSGDDDLTVQHMLASGNHRVATCIERLAQMDSKLPTTARGWQNQKQRHWTTVRRYGLGHGIRLSVPQALTGLWILLGLWAFLVGFGSGVLHIVLWIVGAGLGSAWLIAFLTFRSIAKASQTPDHWLHFGWLQPLGACWVWMMAIRMVFVPSKRKW